MQSLMITAFYVFFVLALPVFARDIITLPVGFDKGESSTIITGRIEGYDVIDYQLRAAARQRLVVDFKPDHLAAYINILPPGANDVAMFVGSTSGNHFDAQLGAEGVYTIRVYLMRSAARRNTTANYTIDVALTDDWQQRTVKYGEPVSAPGNLEWSLALQGIGFHVTSSGQSSLNTLTLVPSGLEIDNSPIIKEIDGTVRGVEVADLNADQSPEIYVYVISAGSGSYGSLVAYSANRRKSLSEIYMPPITQNKAASNGYMGHDEFAVVENRLVRRFPIYRDNDTNANPTGGMRQLQYRLVAGEAGWILETDRVVEY
jgi:hypothetical protein